ncbi:LexA family protein [Marinomonas posidonica]|uniref:LexA family protein n=1 Tax=Marinomonas posidonica TaxID=936476 RepID=UPI0037360986
MKTIAERILHRRKELKISQRALGKLLNVSGATISLWETDRTYPNGENLLNLAKVLKTTPEWIRNGNESSSAIKEPDGFYNLAPAPLQPPSKRLPVISHVQAGNWTEAIDYYEAGDDVEWEEAPSSASENAFWLRVVGDSMTAPFGLSISEGMLILVDPDIAPENGKLVVAKLDGTDEVTFKKLVIDAGQKSLRPLNTTYSPITINGNCRIVGVVTEVKMKL